MFQTLVFAYDGTPECRDALKEGIELAGRLNARCHLLAVVPAPPALALAVGPLPDGYMENAQADIDKVLAEGLALLREAGLDAVGCVKIWEEPAEAIGQFAREVGADFVVVGHHRRSAMDRWWHGSVGHSLLDRLQCSLFVSMPRAAAIRSR
jgi:nucleotide-binding universal stress UspA family protein